MIHPTASIDSSAQIDSTAEIGPYCVIGPRVVIGAQNRLMERVSVPCNTTIGQNNVIYPGAVVGGDPQDLSFSFGQEVFCRIGDHNVFRECVTINRGTLKDKTETIIGDHNFFMACCHVGHDGIIGNQNVIANGVLLGGHVSLQDGVVFSGMTAANQFVTVGRHAYIAGMTGVAQDVPPFVKFQGNEPRGINLVGLKRAGFSDQAIAGLREAYRVIWMNDLTLKEAIDEILSWPSRVSEVDELVSFLEAKSAGRFGRSRENTRTW